MVYPRACGGTEGYSVFLPKPGGLSPRVRGNRMHLRFLLALIGSIPARAGEPYAPAFPAGPNRVYPRACGGTGGFW